MYGDLVGNWDCSTWNVYSTPMPKVIHRLSTGDYSPRVGGRVPPKTAVRRARRLGRVGGRLGTGRALVPVTMKAKRIELLSIKLRECAATEQVLENRIIAARAEYDWPEMHDLYTALHALRDQAEAWRTEYAQLVLEVGPLTE